MAALLALSRRRLAVAGAACALVLGLAAPLLTPVPVAAEPPPDPLAAARGWLVTQQQPDGGFEVAQYANFETPTAALVLGELAQTGASWDATAARDAVASVTTGGKSALDYLDDQAESGTLTPDVAAKYIAQVAEPLGISPHDFDPSGDSAQPVDLVATMQSAAGLDGRYRDTGALPFNGLLYIALAQWSLGCAVPQDLVDRIESARQANGSWNYAGDPSGTDDDPDTTGLALLALSRAGVAVGNPAVQAGLGYLATTQDPSGGWAAFGEVNPNSTGVAVVGIQSFGLDTATSAWRDGFFPGTPPAYTSPATYLAGIQDADGHFVGPYDDDYGVNTSATTQAVLALAPHDWFRAQAPSSTACALPGDQRARWLRAAAADTFGRDATLAELEAAAAVLGPDGTVVTKRVDAALALARSLPGREGLVRDLYDRAFGRSPDAGGLAYWSAQLSSRTYESVLAELISSDEFYAGAGGTDSGFVDAMYDLTLGRLPDQAGHDYWVQLLGQGGASRFQVALGFLISSEGRVVQVQDSYQRVLGRSVDASSVAYWRDLLLGGLRTEYFDAVLLASDEYYGAA